MPNTLLTTVPEFPALPPAPAPLSLTAFSYEDRRHILPALSDAMSLCGCWLLDRKQLSLTQVKFHFELQLRSVVELYAALIAAGLELTRGSHLDLTNLCILRKHQALPMGLGGVVTVTLEVSFLEDITLPSVLGTGTAFA